MAKQLYDYWFVQFDFPDENGKPYKSSGGKMVWNDKLKREIPEGWSDGCFSDIANITMGQSPDGSSYNEEGNGVIFYQGSTDFGIRFPSVRMYTTAPTRFAKRGDILMSVRAPVGAVNIANADCCIGRGLSAINAKIGTITYIYFVIHYLKVRFDNLNSAGTTFGSITKDELHGLPVVVPSDDVLKLFESASKPIFDMQMNIGQEIEELTLQRDELLPLLMNGQVSVTQLNNDLATRNTLVFIIIRENFTNMKNEIINTVIGQMSRILDSAELKELMNALEASLSNYDICCAENGLSKSEKESEELLDAFLSAKKIEGCSDKTLKYYRATIHHLFQCLQKSVRSISTADLRLYLSDYQSKRSSSKVTIDNMRRIFSSFFAWLEDEDYIVKSPVRRIHRVRTDILIKETISDESLELLRDACTEIRDLALIDILASTGMRVGELVKMNISDVNFQERQCVVLGKGNKEREVYFNARTKIHLQQYIQQRTDSNPALFVSLSAPHTRLTINGIEVRLRRLGKKINQEKIHPHKFRRTLATQAIDKGMPIEQVQRLLGHVKIDTTLHYAMVNQSNVKMAHRKFLG